MMRQGGREKIKVLVADDQQVIRLGLRRIMEEETDIMLCGEAENAAELLDRVRLEDWDLLILDIGLPDRSGLEVLEEIRTLRPRMKVVVLSMYDELPYVRQAFSLGASGYLSKDCDMDEVMRAVRVVMGGGSYIGRALEERIGRQEANEANGSPGGRGERE